MTFSSHYIICATFQNLPDTLDKSYAVASCNYGCKIIHNLLKKLEVYPASALLGHIHLAMVKAPNLLLCLFCHLLYI